MTPSPTAHTHSTGKGYRDYPIKLIEVLRQRIDSDLAVIYAIDKENLLKLNRSMELICQSPPMELKITKLAVASGIHVRFMHTWDTWGWEASSAE